MNYSRFPLESREPTPETTTADSFIDVERLLSMARRQLRVVVLCMLIGLGLGVLYLQTTPPTYIAMSRVLIDEGLSRIAEEVSAAPANMRSDAAILSQIEILRSSRVAASVVDALSLDENETFLDPPSSLLSTAIGYVRAFVNQVRPSRPPAQSDPARVEIDEETLAELRRNSVRDYAIALLQRSIIAERMGRSYVVAVGYPSHDPGLAAAIANAYTDAYVADQLDAGFEATQQAAEWLQGRLADLRQSSNAAAMAVERFRSEHGLTAARGELLAEQQLSELSGQFTLAQADTARARARYEQYAAALAAGPAQAVANTALTLDQPANSQIATLKARHLDLTRREREIAANYGPDHPQAAMLRNEIELLVGRIFTELEQLALGFRNEYEVALAHEATLRQSIAEASGASAEANESQVRLRELEQQSLALAALYQTFLSRYEEMAQQQSFPIAKARVITQAALPRSAAGPSTTMSLGLGLVLGLILGAGFGIRNEFNERFFRTGDDVSRFLGLKFIGYLPTIGRSQERKIRKHDRLRDSDAAADETDLLAPKPSMRMALHAPSSLFSETLRGAKIAADALQSPVAKVIGIVSALPGEGKSTVAANFAQLLSENGARTLLIDADLRNLGLTQGLGIDAESGLVEAVLNVASWRSRVILDRQTGLAILPAVIRSGFSHTGDLLSSPGMRQLLDEARLAFDYIVVDLPPLGPVVDARAFAPLANGLLVVVEWGRTPRAVVRSTIAGESLLADKVLGVILNRVRMSALPRYGTRGGSEQFLPGYSSYFHDEPQEGLKKATVWSSLTGNGKTAA